DTVARQHVILLDAALLEPAWPRRLERPACLLAFLVGDVHIDPRVRDQSMHLSDSPLHRRPRRGVVVGVRMMRPGGQPRACNARQRKPQRSSQHGPLLSTTIT